MSTIPIDINPPIDTTGNMGSGFNIPLENVAVIIGVSILALVILIYFWWTKPKGFDIDPSLDDLMEDGYDPNKAALVMMLLTFPVMFGVVYGLNYAYDDLLIGGMIIFLCMTGTALPYYIGKLRSREQSRNKKRLQGWLHTKTGEKIPYSFDIGDFGKEVALGKKEREALIKDNPKWKGALDAVHMYPAPVAGGYTTYFLMTDKVANSIKWELMQDFDYWGSCVHWHGSWGNTGSGSIWGC